MSEKRTHVGSLFFVLKVQLFKGSWDEKFCIFKTKMPEIKPFQTQTKDETRIHRVELINEIPIPSIEYVNKNHQVPKELIKYYRANENGYKVLRDRLIWATHPFDFNDPFDSSIHMWDLETFPLIEMKQFLNKLIHKGFSKNLNPHETRKIIFELIFKFLGVYCLNDCSNSDLLWGYYNDHKGFALKFNSKKIERLLGDVSTKD